MFRALTCPSSGGKIVFTHLVSSLSVNVCPVHWLRADWRKLCIKVGWWNNSILWCTGSDFFKHSIYTVFVCMLSLSNCVSVVLGEYHQVHDNYFIWQLGCCLSRLVDHGIIRLTADTPGEVAAGSDKLPLSRKTTPITCSVYRIWHRILGLLWAVVVVEAYFNVVMIHIWRDLRKIIRS